MDALEAVGQPELRETLLFVRSRPRAVSVDEVAAGLATHRTVARSRLERLADAGLLVRGFERRTGRSGPGAGRPAKVYSVAPESAAIEFPDRHYDDLVSLLVDALPARTRRSRLRRIGRTLADRLVAGTRLRAADDRRTALANLCAALGRAGFQASVERVSDEEAVLSSPTCPLRPLVVARPETAEIDRGLWSGLAGAALTDADAATIACETHNCLDGHASCRIVLRFGSSAAVRRR
jgi:predicted ArsR family transcriptional regulator